jgi:phospholipid/cholesterol/gamma-HCH transport system ATP-binding protein
LVQELVRVSAQWVAISGLIGWKNKKKKWKMLQQELGFTVVMVTHDPETLAGLATRLAVLADQRLVACGTAAEVLAVEHPFIRNFFSSGRAAAAIGQEAI